MKINLTLILLFLFSNCSDNKICPDNINSLPLYGGQNKCQEQTKADNDFLMRMDSLFKGDRKKAAQDRINRGWQYFYDGILDTATMRFNQSWLLDSSNAEIYWGLGCILGKHEEFEKSLSFFEKSLALNPDNSNAWLSASTTYGQLFYKFKDQKYLDKTIDYLKKSIIIDSTNSKAFAQLTAAFSYFEQKDSALKYLHLTDKLDSTAIKPEVRKFLTGK